MAFPTIQSVTDTDFATSVTSMPINMPATVNAGDRLIAIVQTRNQCTFTFPSGWNGIAGANLVGSFLVYEKIADGSEGGATVSTTASTATTAAWQVLRITGAHASTASEGTASIGDASSANPPSETASWGGSEDNLFIAMAGHTAITTAAWSAAPTNYSGFAQNGASSGGSACCVAHGYRQLAANTDDPGTFTVSGSNRFWTTVTLVVRPGAAVSPATNGGAFLPFFL